MAHLRLDDQKFELGLGELRIGTGDDAGVRLDAGSETGTLAIITVDARGTAAVRRTSAHTAVSVNGVALGVEPTPLLHGDRIEVAGRELRFSDDRTAGSTVLMPALGALAAAAIPDARGVAGGAAGGRLVSLVDGREYAVPKAGLRIGRDAACDVVVPGSDVSRQHAELSLGAQGYVIRDLSTNGVFVNAQRTGDAHVLHRGDVIRIGSEEFRFYAEHRPAPAAAKPVTALTGGNAPVASAANNRAAPRGGATSRQRERAARAVAGSRRAAPTTAATPPRRAVAMAWIAAALAIGATLFFVIQDRS